MSDDIIQVTFKVLNAKTGEEKLVVTNTKAVPDFGEIGQSEFRVALDDWETALIETAKASQTEATNLVLSAASKKKTVEAQNCCNSKELTLTTSNYRVETKFGFVCATSHRLMDGRKTVFDSANEYFIATGSRESLHTSRFEKVNLWLPTKLTYRDAMICTKMMRDDDSAVTNPMTIRNQATRQGGGILSFMMNEATMALAEAGFENGVVTLPQGMKSPDWNDHLIDKTAVESAAKALKITTYNVEDYENSETVANVSVDDVCAKAQTAARPKHGELNNENKSKSKKKGKKKSKKTDDEKKRINTSVVHFQNSEGEYGICGDNVSTVLLITLGFMAKLGLLAKTPIVFFSDGARTIHDGIERDFAFTNYKIIMDWHHLQKKVKEFFSLALNGRIIRNKQASDILKLLWFGKVNEAIAFIEHMDPSLIRNKEWLDKLTAYFERLRPCIPCYALRKKLGLRNSSNRVEELNNRLVSRRQKKGGMSWSELGSPSLASITCADRNGQLVNWIKNRTIEFKLVPKQTKVVELANQLKIA